MDMKKFQVTISFEIDDEINALIPKHRKYINTLINKEIIDHYAVSLESKKIWITISAEDKAALAREALSHTTGPRTSHEPQHHGVGFRRLDRQP